MQVKCSRSTERMADIALYFFFNDTATTEIYTLSLHDALPIYFEATAVAAGNAKAASNWIIGELLRRSEEHTSELQSQSNIVCRLLLEKKKISMTLLRSAFTHVTPSPTA